MAGNQQSSASQQKDETFPLSRLLRDVIDTLYGPDLPQLISSMQDISQEHFVKQQSIQSQSAHSQLHAAKQQSPQQHSAQKHSPQGPSAQRHLVQQDSAQQYSAQQHSPQKHSTQQNSSQQHSSQKHSPQRHLAQQHSAQRPSAQRPSAQQHSAQQYSAQQHSAQQHSAQQRSAKQHSAQQHSTQQHVAQLTPSQPDFLQNQQQSQYQSNSQEANSHLVVLPHLHYRQVARMQNSFLLPSPSQPSTSQIIIPIPHISAHFAVDQPSSNSQSSYCQSPEYSNCPGLSSRVSLTMFVCGVPRDVTLLRLQRVFLRHGAEQLHWHETLTHSLVEDAQRCLGDCLHVTFRDLDRMKKLIRDCIYDDKDEYFYFMPGENSYHSKPHRGIGQWVQLVPWDQHHDVWCGDLQCSDSNDNKAVIRNVCGNLSSRKLAGILSKRFGQVGYCILHLRYSDTPNFYPSGTGNVVFVRAVDCRRAISAGRVGVRNSTHASTLYITSLDGNPNSFHGDNLDLNIWRLSRVEHSDVIMNRL